MSTENDDSGCTAAHADLIVGNDACCSANHQCFHGEGDCDSDDGCKGSGTCGTDNCPWGDNDDCCSDDPVAIEAWPESQCSTSQFECCDSRTSGARVCITDSWVDDGGGDCDDYSDERGKRPSPAFGGFVGENYAPICSCKPNNGDLVECILPNGGGIQAAGSRTGAGFNPAYLVGPVILLVILGASYNGQQREAAPAAAPQAVAFQNRPPAAPVPQAAPAVQANVQSWQQQAPKPVARPPSALALFQAQARAGRQIGAVQQTHNPYGGQNPYAQQQVRLPPSHVAAQAQPLPAAPDSKPFESSEDEDEVEDVATHNGDPESEWYWTTFGMAL